MKKLSVFCIVAAMLLSMFSVLTYAENSESITLFYDDYYTFSDAKSIVSSDTGLLSVSGNTVHAIGITGDDPVSCTVDSKEYLVTIKKAKINIAVVAGQSNASGETSGVDSDILAEYQRVIPDRGTAYLWQENASAPVDFNDGKSYSKGGFRGAFAAEWYALSSQRGTPEKTVTVFGLNYTATPGEKISEWVSDDTSKARHDKTAAMFNACYDYYTKGEGSKYFELCSSGMYWLQGESDKSQTTEYYYNAFSSLWNNLKAETENHLSYCAFMRVRGSKTSDCSLAFSGPVVAQYQLANENSDIFVASNITENWAADKTADLQNTVSVDVSNYHIFGDGQYDGIVKNGVLTEQIRALYGGLHYSYLGYAVIGADAAYNMYRSLNCPDNNVTVAAADGKAGSVISSAGGQIDHSTLNGNILVYATPGSSASTVRSTVACTGDGARDITKAVLNGISSKDTAFLINRERLLNYVDPCLSVQTSFGIVPVKVLTGVAENPDPFGEDDSNGVFYHFDFTDAASYKKGLDGNKTVSGEEALKIRTASDSTAYGVMEYNNSENTGLSFDGENGLTRSVSASDMFLLYNKEGENGITATLSNGFVVEFTAKFDSDKHAGILLGSLGSNSYGAHPFVFRYNSEFTMGGSTPSVRFAIQNGSVDYTQNATYRFEYKDGSLKLVITQGETKIEALGTINGEITENFYTFKTFMPNFRTEYNFKGSVSDLKIWTSYYYGVEFDGSPKSTYTVSGIKDCVTADSNRFTVTGNGVYKVESVFFGEKELIPDENGVYTLNNVNSDICLTVNTKAQIGDHTVDNGTVIKETECLSAGIRRYHCTDLNCDFYYDEEIPALGHDMDGGTVKFKPTANGVGLKVYSCRRSGCEFTENEWLPALSPTYYHWDFKDYSAYDTSSGYKVKTAPDSEAAGCVQYTSSDSGELSFDSSLGIVREKESTSAFEIINKDKTSGITLSLTNGFAIEFTAAFNADGYSILLGKNNKQGQGHPYIFKSGSKSFTIGGISPKASFNIQSSNFSASNPATYLFTCDGENFRMKVTQNGVVCYDDYLIFDSAVSENHFTFAYLFPNFRTGNNFSGSLSDLKIWTSYCINDTELKNVTSDIENWYAESGRCVSQIASVLNDGSLYINGGTLCSKLFRLTGSKQGKSAVIKLRVRGKSAQMSLLKDGTAATLDSIAAADDYTEFVTSPVVLDREDNLLSLMITANGTEVSEITLMYLDEGGISNPVNTDGSPYGYDYGDVNCDGKVDILDFVRMKKKIAGVKGTNIYLAAANLTKKGSPLPDGEDIALLVKKIIEP